MALDTITLAAAKKYTDKEIENINTTGGGLTSQERSDLEENTKARHTHSNKETLDQIPLKFSSFPNEEQVRNLTSGSYFTVKGLNTTYRKVDYWVSNGIYYPNPDVYIYPIDQPKGEIYLPFYNIKEGEQYAEHNSNIMDRLTRQVNTYGIEYGSIFILPAGHFYFARTIDLVRQPLNDKGNENHYSFKGVASSTYKNTQAGLTFLHFPNLTEGQAAMRVGQCSISNFIICGSNIQYNLSLDRNKLLEGKPEEVVKENIGVKACGIYAKGGMIINNVGFKNLYCGCYCETSNMFITDTTFHQCHYGLSIGHDIKVQNLSGANVMTLLQMRGSVSSATNVRGDSIGKHLVELLGGHSNTLVDLDCDFGMDAIVAIGNGTSNSTVYNLSIMGVHGRAAVRHSYKSSATSITAEDITIDTIGEYGVIAIKNGAALNGAIIITNQGVTQNPFDVASEYLIPFVLMSAGAGTTVKGVQIFSTSYTGNELTEDWIKKRVISLSSLIDACMVKIQTNIGAVIYTKDNSIVTVTDDATDIYDRMDKSALALNDEVVKTVNGIQPDIDGNVEIIEQEPEVVQSIEECVDTSKKYVLPDGYIYAYRKKFVAGSTVPNFTNQLPISLNPLTEEEILNDVGYKEDVIYYYDESNQCMLEKSIYEPIPEESISNRWATGLIPIENGDTVRINAMGYNTTTGIPFCFILVEQSGKMSQGKIWYSGLDNITNGGGEYTSTGLYDKGLLSNVKININGDLFYAIDYGPAKYIWFSILDSTPPEDVIITVNEEITYTITEDHYEWNWENTGKIYEKGEENPRLLPIVTESDNGKILRVAEGKWIAASLSMAEGVDF